MFNINWSIIILLILIRNSVIIFLCILALYKFINYLNPLIKSEKLDNILNLIQVLIQYIKIIKNHLNEMTKIYYPKSLQYYKINLLSHLNISLGIFMLLYFINYCSLIFYIRGFNLDLLLILVIYIVFFYWLSIFIFDCKYLYPFVNIYLLNTENNLQQKFKKNDFLSFCIDPSGNPIRQTFSAKIVNYILNPPVQRNIARTITYTGAVFTICLSCTMGFWGFLSMHQMRFPDEVPLLLQHRLFYNAPTDLETWNKLIVIYPEIQNHPNYKIFIEEYNLKNSMSDLSSNNQKLTEDHNFEKNDTVKNSPPITYSGTYVDIKEDN